jgi:hypothetical protein
MTDLKCQFGWVPLRSAREVAAPLDLAFRLDLCRNLIAHSNLVQPASGVFAVGEKLLCMESQPIARMLAEGILQDPIA